jgi:hypothetical protein
VVPMHSNGCEVCPRILADGRWVADVTGAPYLGFSDTLPNARLIAAAPELMAALESVPIVRLGETLDEFKDRFCRWYRDARNAALAKAGSDK